MTVLTKKGLGPFESLGCIWVGAHALLQVEERKETFWAGQEGTRDSLTQDEQSDDGRKKDRRLGIVGTGTTTTSTTSTSSSTSSAAKKTRRY